MPTPTLAAKILEILDRADDNTNTRVLIDSIRRQILGHLVEAEQNDVIDAVRYADTQNPQTKFLADIVIALEVIAANTATVTPDLVVTDQQISREWDKLGMRIHEDKAIALVEALGIHVER